MVCKSCGFKNKSSDTECELCGLPLDKSGSSNSKSIILYTFLFFIIFMLILYFFVIKN